MRVSCGHVRNPNGPGMRFVGLQEITDRGVARFGRPAHKRYALAVCRPDWITIGVHSRSYEIYRFRGRIIDTDEAVIAARGNENQARAVGRPVFIVILPANHQLLGLFAPTQRNYPDLAVAHIGDDPLRRNLRRIARIHLLRLSAVPSHGPNGLLRSRGIAGGIGKLSGSILALATDVDDRVPV